MYLFALAFWQFSQWTHYEDASASERALHKPQARARGAVGGCRGLAGTVALYYSSLLRLCFPKWFALIQFALHVFLQVVFMIYGRVEELIEMTWAHAGIIRSKRHVFQNLALQMLASESHSGLVEC